MAAADVLAHDANNPELAFRFRRTPGGSRTKACNMTTRQKLPSQRVAAPKVFTSLTYDHLPRLDIINEISPQVAAALTCGDLPPVDLTEEKEPAVVVSVTYEHLPHVDLADDWHRQSSPSTAGELTYEDLPPMGDMDCKQEMHEIVQKSPAAASPEHMMLQDGQKQAPLWSGEPGATLGRFVHRTAVIGPAETLESLKAFFQNDSVPCDFKLDPAAWTLEGVAFMDFAAVGFSVSIFAGSQGGSVIAFSRTGGSDVVLFAQLVGQVIDILAGGATRQPPKLLQMDVEFEDFEDDEEEGQDLTDWDTRVRCVLKSAESGQAALQDAWRTLALWGLHSAESRPHLAKVFCSEEGMGLVARALQGIQSDQASALYPMAAALKFASFAAGTAVSAVDKLLPLLRSADHLPGLVARELDEAANNFEAST